MYGRLAPEKLFISEKALRRSCESRSDHLGARAFPALSKQDVAADLPIKEHQLTVHAPRGPLLGGMDAGLELRKPGAVTSQGP